MMSIPVENIDVEPRSPQPPAKSPGLQHYGDIPAEHVEEDSPTHNCETENKFRMENSTIHHLGAKTPDKSPFVNLEPFKKLPAPVDDAAQAVETNLVWTSTCCNKKRGFIFNFITLMVLSSQIGMIGGFGSAMILIYLEKGMPVSHRAVMNLLAIPFLVFFLNLKKPDLANLWHSY
jgi:hypothetical protein